MNTNDERLKWGEEFRRRQEEERKKKIETPATSPPPSSGGVYTYKYVSRCPRCRGEDIESGGRGEEKYLAKMNIEKLDRHADCFACSKCGFVWAIPVSKSIGVARGVMFLLGSVICIALGIFLVSVFLGSPERLDTMPMPGDPSITVRSGAIGVSKILPLVALFGGGLLLFVMSVDSFWKAAQRYARD